MGLKDEFNKVVDKVKDAVENVKDVASEATHRVVAEVEQQKRNVAGDEMTTDEKASHGCVAIEALSSADDICSDAATA